MAARVPPDVRWRPLRAPPQVVVDVLGERTGTSVYPQGYPYTPLARVTTSVMASSSCSSVKATPKS